MIGEYNRVPVPYGQNKDAIIGGGGGGTPTTTSVPWYLAIGLRQLVLLSLAIIGVVLGAVAIGRQDSGFAARAFIDRMQSHQGAPHGNGRAISIAAIVAEGRPRRVSLCAPDTTVYYSTTGGRINDTLRRLTQDIEEITSDPQMKGAWYYPVEVRIDLEFNTDTTAVRSAATRTLFKSAGIQYMAYVYNITTSYPFVSSVRLDELEFQPYNAAYKRPRRVLMCSNVLAGTKRCDHGAAVASPNGRASVLFEPETLSIATIHSVTWRQIRMDSGGEEEEQQKQQTPKTPFLAPTTSPRLNDLTVVNSEDDLYDQIETNDVAETIAAIERQKESILGLRIYDLVFYRRSLSSNNKPTTPFIPNPHTSTGTTTGNGGSNAITEEKLFTIQLQRCPGD